MSIQTVWERAKVEGTDLLGYVQHVIDDDSARHNIMRAWHPKGQEKREREGGSWHRKPSATVGRDKVADRFRLRPLY
jgi:hypothetical protein